MFLHDKVSLLYYDLDKYPVVNEKKDRYNNSIYTIKMNNEKELSFYDFNIEFVKESEKMREYKA